MTAEKKIADDAALSNGSSEDEEIIELTEELSAVSGKDDNDIIELSDVVAETDSAPAGPVSDPADQSAEDASSLAVDEIEIADEIEEETDFDEGEPDDFVNSLGMDLETDSAISQLAEENEASTEPAQAEAASLAPVAISPEQLEAVIERVIMKILPEKIDGILSAAIEKTLTKEINRIKEILSED